MSSMKSLALRSRPLALLLALISASIAATAAQPQQQTALYKDPAAPLEQRIDYLLSRMTPEEKLAEITTVWTQKGDIMNAAGEFDVAKARKRYPAGIGHFARPSDLRGLGSPDDRPFRDERQTVALVNAIQRYNVTETRLGIPALFHEESLHGYSARGATNFPQSIALASTWDPPLLTRIFTVAGREVRARGVQLVLAPVVDVARDPRWGRIEETYGEDPYLVGEMGVAAIRGFQGDSLPLAPGHVFATLKHMTGHGQPEAGTNVGPAGISERVLREIFFPPFAAAVKRANVQSVMASYNEIDGVPSHANGWLLNQILRGEMGFQGAVVSDYWGISQLADIHHVEADLTGAAARALKAGVDADLPDGNSFANLPAALAQGRVTQADIDQAVRRMLRLKFLSGLFENPYADAKYAEAITGNAEARALAEEAARKAIVLLKNDGTLPLHADTLKTLAVIGPNAAVARLGGYSNVPRHAISVLDGIRAKLGNRVRVVTAEGVRLTDKGSWYEDEVVIAKPQENRARIAEAVKIAQGADAIVLVLGGSSATSREGWGDNHLGDTTSLELVGEQNELARALYGLGKPVVVVLINGRPQSVIEISERANALVEGWYLGQEGGTAMAQILFGDANPGGKLPVTIARNAGQLPLTYNQKPSSHRGYLFDSKDPLYPFGFGLSYTSFEIGAPVLSASTIRKDGSVNVNVDVRNTGMVAGDEVVQLYIRDVVSSVTRPVKELRGFQRVTLAPGESKQLAFTIGPDALALWDKDMKHVVEPGEFKIMVGPNSMDLKTVALTVTE
ncbi:MAG TPA: glycoside hydrolase family 3 N-terminal domain-containing protein [Steroidobacteraceae bacterium]|nr:glycoside hydrolase family 3 N-terminal domain-containing protein [Steroidobacteraceae bacterium]